MKKVLITYDLRQPGRNYSELYTAIQKLGTCARILESVWLAQTQFDTTTVHREISKVLDRNDGLFVCEYANEKASGLRP